MNIDCRCGTRYEYTPDNTDVIKTCPNCNAPAYAYARFTNPWIFKEGIPLSESESNVPVVPMREKILHEALGIVTKDRNQDYGNPEDNFATIAEYWNTYLRSKSTDELKAHDVAAMMILMKCSRLATSPGKSDHWVDIAGYAACGGECAK